MFREFSARKDPFVSAIEQSTRAIIGSTPEQRIRKYKFGNGNERLVWEKVMKNGQHLFVIYAPKIIGVGQDEEVAVVIQRYDEQADRLTNELDVNSFTSKAAAGMSKKSWRYADKFSSPTGTPLDMEYSINKMLSAAQTIKPTTPSSPIAPAPRK